PMSRLAQPLQHLYVPGMHRNTDGLVAPFDGTSQHLAIGSAGNDVDLNLLAISVEPLPTTPFSNRRKTRGRPQARIGLLGDCLEYEAHIRVQLAHNICLPNMQGLGALQLVTVSGDD